MFIFFNNKKHGGEIFQRTEKGLDFAWPLGNGSKKVQNKPYNGSLNIF